MHTIQDVSENTLRIEQFIQTLPYGEVISYGQVYDQTKVVMDNKGKTYLRSALKRLKMPHETIRGVGIKLLSKENATKIVVRDVTKIDRSVKRAERTTIQVRERVFDELTEEQRKHINFLGSIFGAIRSYSQSAKQIFKKEPLKIGEKISD